MNMQPPPSIPSGPQPVYYPGVNMAHGGPQYRSTQSISSVFTLTVTHNLTQLCLGGVIVSCFITGNSVNPLFPILKSHIFLCSVGYLILIAQAILSFSPVGWANNLKHEHKRIIHGMFQTIGTILAVTGSLIELIDSKFVLNTAHGICGLVAMVLTIISFVAGIFNRIFSQNSNIKCIKVLYSSLAIVTMSVVFVSLIIGLHNYYRYVAGNANANIAIALTVCAFTGTCVTVIATNFKEILNVDKTTNNMS